MTSKISTLSSDLAISAVVYARKEVEQEKIGFNALNPYRVVRQKPSIYANSGTMQLALSILV